MVAERNVCYVVWSLDHKIDIIIEHVDMSSVKRSIKKSTWLKVQGFQRKG